MTQKKQKIKQKKDDSEGSNMDMSPELDHNFLCL